MTTPSDFAGGLQRPDAGWINLSAAIGGNGNGRVGFTVGSSNGGAARTGTIIIAGWEISRYAAGGSTTNTASASTAGASANTTSANTTTASTAGTSSRSQHTLPAPAPSTPPTATFPQGH